MEGITWELLEEKGYARLNVGEAHERAPHAEGNFPTPSGKCEFKASTAAEGNWVVPVWRSMYEAMQPGEPIDALLPDYVAPFESPTTNPELAAKYPLNIVSPKPHAFLNSQYANDDRKKRVQGEQKVFIHPTDAAARSIEAGEHVRVFNDRGWFQGPAEIDEALMPGLVMAHVGHWASSGPAQACPTARSTRSPSTSTQPWAWPASTATISSKSRRSPRQRPRQRRALRPDRAPASTPGRRPTLRRRDAPHQPTGGSR